MNQSHTNTKNPPTTESTIANTLIESAKAELTECDGCKGECLKSRHCYLRPVPDKFQGGYQMPYALCKFDKLRQFRQGCGHCQIPKKYITLTFKDYQVTKDNEQAVGLARRFIKEKPPEGLYLYGATGTGKTFLSALIAKAILYEGKSVIFGDVPTLLDEIKRTFGEQSKTQAVINRYCDCDLLILDDIGAGQMNDWSVGIIYQIINARYNADKQIIATSNFDLTGLAKRLASKDKYSAERIISRLSEMCIPALLGTFDRRRQK